ncbi:MAG: hypothetical protein M0Z58_03475 [Nitrospiraceae bacterium]|nr:hypothetical protein [Nitrospiraceae bacterium]
MSKLKRAVLGFIFIQFFIVIGFSGYKAWQNTSKGCIKCHSNRQELAKLGYPELYVTPAMVARQSHHANATCRDCHLGNGWTDNMKKAHEGMLKALFISDTGGLVPRTKVLKGALVPGGDDKIRALIPKVEYDGQLYANPEVRNILWEDRNPETFNFDPDLAKKSCGRPSCHPDQLKQFITTDMGTNYRQRRMKSWMVPFGPHNCGPSFADLPPEKVLKGSGFDYANTKMIAAEMDVPFSRAQARVKQKFCNVCHPGCLDCHFTPGAKDGAHHFSRVPPAVSCEGYGRGTSICHPGAMQSRRGETYSGGDYSIPTGEKPDIHYKLGLKCVDCHMMGPKGMGDMMRNATCQDCHIEAEEALARSVHRNLDCAACHVSQLRGYQLTMWGPGTAGGKPTPFKKYSLYYGIQAPPIIMKDQEGKWRPYKVWPHALGNFEKNVPPSGKVQFRWPDGQTHDAYYIAGTVGGLPADNKQLLWLEIEQAAHPYGKARSCRSCHGRAGRQVSESRWRFEDSQGALPFNGTEKIVADKNGLRIEDLKNTTPIVPVGSARIADFAAWVYMKDKWRAPGDFSIKTDPAKYKKSLKIWTEAQERFEPMEKKSAGFGREKLIRFKRLEELVFHNEKEAFRDMKRFR